jgi:nucleoside-diphosphate-sugar epimerase
VNVFVTGGTGLVGSHAIARFAEQGHEVRALVRSEKGARMVEALGALPVLGRVESRDDWALVADTDLIIHAAALVVTSTTWDRYVAVNVDGTRHAVEAAATTGARLIHISSIAVYGLQPDAHAPGGIDETFPYEPIADADFYARSKREAEQVLWRETERLGVSAVALRPCLIYGERERLFMGRLLRILRLGVAPIVGPGENRLAMVYAGNVVDAIECAVARPHVHGAFNTTNDGAFTQREFYAIIARGMKRRIRQVRVPTSLVLGIGRLWYLAYKLTHPGKYMGVGSSSGRFMARENPYTSAKAEGELGWVPRTAPDVALQRSVEWFLDGRRGS